MIHDMFFESKEIQEAAAAYTEKHGGYFLHHEPDGRVFHDPDDGNDDAFLLPDDATPEQVLQDLRSGKKIADLWPKMPPYDPELLY